MASPEYDAFKAAAAARPVPPPPADITELRARIEFVGASPEHTDRHHDVDGHEEQQRRDGQRRRQVGCQIRKHGQFVRPPAAAPAWGAFCADGVTGVDGAGAGAAAGAPVLAGGACSVALYGVCAAGRFHLMSVPRRCT